MVHHQTVTEDEARGSPFCWHEVHCADPGHCAPGNEMVENVSTACPGGDLDPASLATVSSGPMRFAAR